MSASSATTTTRARHGVNWPLYLLARVFMTPFFLVYFRYGRTGREHGRVKGGLIVAANHRSFLDPFVIGGALPWRRPMNYVAKVELFERRWQGWLLSRLGAFPIRRGESDEAVDGDRPPGRRARRHRLHLPRGHADPQRLPGRRRSAASAGWRCRPAPRSCRPRCSAPSTCAAAGGSARARSRSGSAGR